MSVNIFHKTGSGTGTLQKVAGNTVILDANVSEIRNGNFSLSITSTAGYFRSTVTFATPMPDTDYIVNLEVDTADYLVSNITPLIIDQKTVNGFRINWYGQAGSGVSGVISGKYYAFKPIPMDGYTELQNKVNNPDNMPTQNSDNLVKSGGVFEALKDAGTVFTGTKAEWEALDPSEQERYEIVCITDDEESSGGGSTSEVYRNPDWSRVVDLTTHAFSIDAYVVPEDGIFIVCRFRPVSTDVISTMLINGNPFIQSKSPITSNADVNSNTCIPVTKGDSITIDNPRIQDPVYFVPYKSTVVENRIPLNYTTTEQFTGKYWVDGKPIYRKVISDTLTNSTLTESRQSFVKQYSLNADTTISVSGYVVLKSASTWINNCKMPINACGLPTTTGPRFEFTVDNIDNTIIEPTTGVTRFIGTWFDGTTTPLTSIDIYVSLEYTKTN